MEKLSVKQLYQHFLTEIRKDYTGTVIPDVWNTIMRDALLEWKTKLAKELDFGIYAMAEQAGIRVITDGESNYNQIKLIPSISESGVFVMDNPMVQNGTNIVALPTDNTWNAGTNTPALANGIGTTGMYYRCTNSGTVNFGAGNIAFSVGDYVQYNGTIWSKVLNYVFNGLYPCMFRRLSVRVGYVKTVTSSASKIVCNTPCHELSGFESNDVFSNHYRKPSLRKSYYSMADKWKFYTPTDITFLYVILDYICEPLEIKFDPTTPADQTVIVGNPYTKAGSVNTNLSEGVKRELVNIAAKNFLKNVGDPRYQAYLQEQQLRIKG